MTSPAEARRAEAPGGGGRRAAVVGLGLIGGSVGMALRARGWHVTGRDASEGRAADALARGALDATGDDPAAELTVVATPVQAVAAEVRRVLATGPGLVTDVGSVKAPVVAAVADPRFLGGHPMAGSEQEGLDGASAAMFEGAVWVLTPTSATPDRSFAELAAVVASLGAEVVALAPERHDALVAVVSHVPHLTAATLMQLADERAEEHAALLRLAAGGFRDMTRVASGHPAIWPDICAENRQAIVGALDALLGRLRAVRDAVDGGDREALLAVLAQARAARANLPGRVARPADVAEVRIPVPDRPGVLAEITTLAAELGVNTVDLEIAHSAEGDRGVVIMLVEAGAADVFRGGLRARGYRPSVQPLT